MDKNRIYAVQTDASGKVSLAQVWAQTAASGLAAGLSNLVVMEIDDRIVLVGYNKATQETTVYGLSDGDPWIQPLDNRIDQAVLRLEVIVHGCQVYLGLGRDIPQRGPVKPVVSKEILGDIQDLGLGISPFNHTYD